MSLSSTVISIGNDDNDDNNESVSTSISAHRIVSTDGNASINTSASMAYRSQKRKNLMTIQKWILVITSAIMFCLFRIESMIYEDIKIGKNLNQRETPVQEERSIIVDNEVRRGTSKIRSAINSTNKESNLTEGEIQGEGQGRIQGPVKRYGFIPRGSLRTPIIIASLRQIRDADNDAHAYTDADTNAGIMIFDHFEIERMEYDLRRTSNDISGIINRNSNNNSIKKNRTDHHIPISKTTTSMKVIPRTIELDDQFNRMKPRHRRRRRSKNDDDYNYEGHKTLNNFRRYEKTITRKIELEYNIEKVNDDGYNGNDEILDFERPWYEECESIMAIPLPIVHPTCNDIHQLSLTTALGKVYDGSRNSSSLPSILSMKGSWRSVWKVKDDLYHEHHSHRNHHNRQMQKVESGQRNGTDINTKKLFHHNNATSYRSVVIKVLHLHRQFNHESYKAHGTDIMVMDRLTSSPYVVDAYGFCGQSVVTEFGMSGRNYIKRYDISSQQRLRVARNLARGLADVQALQPLPHSQYMNDDDNNDYDNEKISASISPDIPIVFAHNDITIANTVMINERIKWNDFNIGVFLRRKKKKNSAYSDRSGVSASAYPGLYSRRHERSPKSRSLSTNTSEKDIIQASEIYFNNASIFTAFTADFYFNYSGLNDSICPSPVKFRNDLWRSPEEIRNTSYVQLSHSDVYGLGNILYQTMTRHQPWTFKEPGGVLTKLDVAERKRNGTIPYIPEQYLTTTKRSLQTLFGATHMCYYPKPGRRPTARRLAYGLGKLYNKIKHKKRVTRPIILDYLTGTASSQHHAG